MRNIYILLLLIVVFGSCEQEKTSDNLVEQLLWDNEETLQPVVDDLDKYEVQIIYTQIDRDEFNTPKFTSHQYRVNSTEYFYPASTVKMPTALLAMEKIRNLNRYMDMYRLQPTSTMLTDSARAPQTQAYVDSTSVNLLPSVQQYLKKIFIISDNDAYNRLYEFVGQDYLNNTLRNKGFTSTKIIHRLSAPNYDPLSNLYTNPIRFVDDEGETIYEQPEVKATGDHSIPLTGLMKGVAYTTNEGELIEEPFDFSQKNYFSLSNFERIMRATMFHDYTEKKFGFQLTDEDFKYIHKCMSMYPNESKNSTYDDHKENYDSYAKFFMYGDTKEPIPDNIRIFNKTGWAYGYLTDCSYIVDFENNVEFILAATIHINDNQTYNDGVYGYEEIGLPFLSNLGKIIYEHDLNRERQHIPDLSMFKFDYSSGN